MKKYKGYTQSRRNMTTVDYGGLSKVKPMKASTSGIKKRAGRNNTGRITVRHQGGGVKQVYRIIDFKQNKLDIPARIEALEYDPYRSAFIARVVYRDGERHYHLAHSTAKVGDSLIISVKSPLKAGNRTILKKIPAGYEVHNL